MLCDVDADLHSVGEQVFLRQLLFDLLRTLQSAIVALRERHKREVAELRRTFWDVGFATAIQHPFDKAEVLRHHVVSGTLALEIRAAAASGNNESQEDPRPASGFA